MLTGPEVIDAVSMVTGVPMQFTLGGEPMTRVKQLATPQDIGRGGEAMAVDALMQSFFQSNRRTPPQAGNRPSTLQALLMMKSTVVNDRVQASAKGRVAELVQSTRTDGEIVDELYLDRDGPHARRRPKREVARRRSPPTAPRHRRSAVGAAQQPRVPGQPLTGTRDALTWTDD